MKFSTIGFSLFIALSGLTFSVGASAAPVDHAEARTASPIYPGKQWETIASPESVGFSSARLRAIGDYLKGLDTTAVHVSVGGKTLFEYGDLTRQSYLASARKSFLAALYGKYVENGTIDLDASLETLGISDTGGLMPRELEATVEDIISARSGVYHPASNPGDSTGSAPPRGSQRHGDYYLYNNWDFNAAGAIFEKRTGKDIFAALQSDIAVPIGMQDFKLDLQQKTGDEKRSEHPAYHMTLSTRDMARFGLLIARGGKWNGTQVIPETWVRKMTSLVTPMNEMNPPAYRSLATGDRWGYGYMWWVWDAPGSKGPFAGAYSAMGAFGQYITVLPALDMVITHKTDPAGEPGMEPAGVSGAQYAAILRMFVAAKLGPGESTVPRIPPSPKELAALELLKSGRVDAGVKTMLALHKSNPIPAAREGRLNLMGYQYQMGGKTKEALAIFQMITQLYPDSPNAWDSYGETLLASGAKDKGKAAYQRSLKLAEASTTLDAQTRKLLVENARKVLGSQ